MEFQSTPSCGGRPEHLRLVERETLVSIHALLRRATPGRGEKGEAHVSVSIHALLRRATISLPISQPIRGVSIHALLRRATQGLQGAHTAQDVSIHALLRRATYIYDVYRHYTSCFNPRPPAEGDYCISSPALKGESFNPRPPAEGDAPLHSEATLHHSVSIHALLRRATIHALLLSPSERVSIHALLRRATSTTALSISSLKFQSTPSCGGRLQRRCSICNDTHVSIHALLRRATRHQYASFSPNRFQSTPSCGGRQTAEDAEDSTIHVSIHALLRRATSRILPCPRHGQSFNPRPPAEGDLILVLRPCGTKGFQSTPSCGGRRTLVECQ